MTAPTYEAIIQRAKDEAWAVMDEQMKKIWFDRAKALLNGEELLRKNDEMIARSKVIAVKRLPNGK